MRQCEYCLEYKLEDDASARRHEPKRKLLFPDGRILQWSWVCWDCIQARNEWEQKRNVERFQEAERRRQWHREVEERREQKRREAELRSIERETERALRDERQRATDMVKMANLEAQIAICTASLETLRKKYFSQEGETHLTPTK